MLTTDQFYASDIYKAALADHLANGPALPFSRMGAYDDAYWQFQEAYAETFKDG